MAEVLPFPRWRHGPFVQKHASNLASVAGPLGEKYLANQLRGQRDTMLNRGIDPETVSEQVGALESAIRLAAAAAPFWPSEDAAG